MFPTYETIAEVLDKGGHISDAEHISDADIQKRRTEIDEREKRQVFENLWRCAGVRARQKESPVKSGGPWDVKLKALGSRLGTGMLVVLLGRRGCGKTQLAVELIRQSCQCGKPALYTTAMEIFVALRDSYKLQESEQQVLRRYQNPAFLAIDEVQERGETEWEDRLLTSLLDYRYSMLRDTVLIGNQTEAAFKSGAGTSVSSRMMETGGIAFCDWPSFRNGAH